MTVFGNYAHYYDLLYQDKNYVGEYATSLEMAGASISLLALNDERLALLNAPAESPFFKEA